MITVRVRPALESAPFNADNFRRNAENLEKLLDAEFIHVKDGKQ